MSKSSERKVDVNSENQRIALTQASNALTESLAMRRALDNKIYGLIALTATLLALVVTVEPWSSRGILGLVFLVVALGIYLLVIGLGLREYSPTDISVFDARTIFNRLEKPTEKLMRWTTRLLLDCADENYSKVDRKSSAVEKMTYLFLAATVLLAIGAVLN